MSIMVTIIYLILILTSLIIIVSVYSLYYEIKFISYLKKNNLSRYQYLWSNDIKGFDKPLRSFLRGYYYLNSDMDEEDVNIKLFKNHLRISGKIGLVLLMLLTLLIIILLLSVV